ncbi:MAG: hypothetical protein O3A76_14550 [Chloroflexi bacterium]|nr:hypothetical protein [Chloroflexota bacterium]
MSYGRTLRITALRRLGGAVLIGFLVAVLPVAAEAHHPEITADVSCHADTGVPRIDYVAAAWNGYGQDPTNDPSRANADIRVRLSVDGGSFVEIGRGAFVAPELFLQRHCRAPAR